MQYLTLSEGHLVLITGFNKCESPVSKNIGKPRTIQADRHITGARCVRAGQMRFRLKEVNQFRTIGTSGHEKLGAGEGGGTFTPNVGLYLRIRAKLK